MKWFIAFLLLLALLVGYWGWPLFALRGRTANVPFGSQADIPASPGVGMHCPSQKTAERQGSTSADELTAV